jgi:hypothetical protein
MAHHRLTMIDQAFVLPRLPRKRRKAQPGPVPRPPKEPPPRSQRLVSPREVGRIILAVPLWAILAEICWVLLPADRGNPGFLPNYWRLITLTWLLVGSLVLAAGVIGYLRLLRQTPAEALLTLQDVAWRETRWEQRRISRWFAWAHVRSSQPAVRRDFKVRWWLLLILIVVLAAAAVILFG